MEKNQIYATFEMAYGLPFLAKYNKHAGKNLPLNLSALQDKWLLETVYWISLKTIFVKIRQFFLSK